MKKMEWGGEVMKKMEWGGGGRDEKDGVGGGEVMRKMEWGGGGGRGRCGRRRR